jgi:hypothetical protein
MPYYTGQRTKTSKTNRIHALQVCNYYFLCLKKKRMKKIFILIVLSIIVSGCVDGGQCFKSSVKIINNSGKDIEVSSYKNEYVNGSTILTKIFSKKQS